MDDHGTKRILNAGSGRIGVGALPRAFDRSLWTEMRMDIDSRNAPDYVASICDMRSVIEDASFDAVWSSHCIEHLHDHEVLPALREFKRILREDGFAIVNCPSMDAIAKLLVSDGIESVAYLSPAGPVRLLDMIFGHSRSIEAGKTFMTHKTGFTADRIGRLATNAGFAEARVIDGETHDLWAALMMRNANLSELATLFEGASIRALFQDQLAPDAPAPRTARPKRVRILCA
jgi:predicted SAM-dependent methyltransferase